MAKNNKQEIKVVEILLNSIQICLELQITGYYRGFVLKKYNKQSFTLDVWKEKLSKDGLEIK